MRKAVIKMQVKEKLLFIIFKQTRNCNAYSGTKGNIYSEMDE